MDNIANKLALASLRYHNGEDPIMTDEEYDRLRDAVEMAAPDHHVLNAVGAPVPSDKRVMLPYYMGSLDKVKTTKGLSRWASAYAGPYCIMDKLDGISGQLVYDSGTGVCLLYSRGNGYEGHDLSKVIPYICGLPDLSKSATVRGELIVSIEDYNDVKEVAKTSRNLVAGLMNAKTPDASLLGRVHFVAYEVLDPPGMSVACQLNFLESNGFEVVPHIVRDTLDWDTLEGVLVGRKASSRYEIDGMVVSPSSESYRHVDGENPKYAIAFKGITPDGVAVHVREVTWSASKDGLLKPVVIFDPIQDKGVTLQRATGFNAKFIIDNGVGPGAEIKVTRSGDVIPYITAVLKRSTNIVLPTEGHVWNATGVDLVVEDKSCKELVFQGLRHFFDVANAANLGEKTLRKLFDAGFTTVGDILSLCLDDLVKIPGIQGRSAERLIAGVHECVTRLDPPTWLYASNLFGRGVGVKALTLVLDAFPNALTSGAPSKIDLTGIKGIGAKMAENIYQGFTLWPAFVEHNNLSTHIGNVATPDTSEDTKKLADEHIVFTGKRNKDIEAFAVRMGAVLERGITRKTTLLLCSSMDAASSKMQAAREKNVPIMLVSQFAQLHGL
jgi:DNA ligase (NAD+)